MAEIIRVLMVDDYPLLQVGVRTALDQTQDIRLIAFADHTAHTETLCERLAPHVLLYSSRPFEDVPLDRLAELRQLFPAMKILLMVADEQRDQGVAALDTGVNGVILKGDAQPLLERAVHTIMGGEVWLSPSISPAPPRSPGLGLGLTEREAQVLELIARGWDNAAIAAELYLAEQTVRNYTSRLYQRLGVSSRSEAIIWALENGFGRPK